MTSSVGSVGSVGQGDVAMLAEAQPYRARLYDETGNSLFVWSGTANSEAAAIDLAKAEYHAWCRAADIGLGRKDTGADYAVGRASAFQRRSKFCGIGSFMLNDRLSSSQSGMGGLGYGAILDILNSAAQAEPKFVAAMSQGFSAAVELGAWVDRGYLEASSAVLIIEDEYYNFENKYIEKALRLVYIARMMTLSKERNNSYHFYGYDRYNVSLPSAVLRALVVTKGPQPPAALLNWLGQHRFDDFAQRIRTSLAR